VDRLRDNSWIFGLGAAVLSFPITVFALGEAHSSLPHSRSYASELWWVAACGSLGMFVACRSAYANTRQSGLLVERVVLLTGLSYGMAFVIASIPFFVFTPVGMAFAWMGGVTMVGPPIFVFTILWSILYTWALGPKRVFQERRSIVQAASPEFARLAAWSLLSAMTLVFALYIKV
jgi:hypothetical protein